MRGKRGKGKKVEVGEPFLNSCSLRRNLISMGGAGKGAWRGG